MRQNPLHIVSIDTDDISVGTAGDSEVNWKRKLMLSNHQR